MFECVTCFLLLFSRLAAPALCRVKMRDPGNEVADFRSVNTSGVVKRQSSQVTPHDFAIAVRLVSARSHGSEGRPPLYFFFKSETAT